MLVVAMIFSTAVVNNTDVYAAKKKVKSVKTTNLKGKKLTLQIGKKKTLKVKVSVYGKTSKKFTVKSSKKTVVAAKKSGKKVVLTAKKAGKAKITIAAKANKKKKKVITVTVPAPPAKVPATPVTPVINPDKPVAAHDYIMTEKVIPLKQNVRMKDLYIPFKLENDFSITNVSGLPKGIEGEKIGDKYMVNGIPTETGIFKASVTAKDKVNNEKNTTEVTFVIGSDSNIVAYCPVISGYYYSDASENVYESMNQKLYIVGGSGDFKLSTVGGNSTQFAFDDIQAQDFYSTADVIVNFKSVGTFKTTAVVKDITNGDMGNADLTLAISQGQKVTGRVTDVQGQGVKGLSVSARSTTYYDTVFEAETDNNGYYELFVSKDSYSVSVMSIDLVLAETEAVAINKDLTLNYKIQGYTVTLVSSNSKIDLESAEWFNNGEKTKYYGSGNKLFMPAGTYSIYADFYDPEGSITDNYVATATFSVSSNKTVTVSVVTDNLPYNVGVISVGTNELRNIGDDIVFYRFVPSQSGVYTIRSKSLEGKDVDAYLYDQNGDFIMANDIGNNIDGNGMDFKIRADFTAGNTYYIAMTDNNAIPDMDTEIIIEREVLD